MDLAKIQSPVLTDSRTPRCFRFWYHMKGALIERLDVIMKSNHGSRILWSLGGHKGSDWKSGNVEIPPLSGNFKVLSIALFLISCTCSAQVHHHNND